MNLLGIDEYDLFHRYRYENNITITIFSNQVIYYDQNLRVVLQCDTGKYSMEKKDEGRVDNLPDLSECDEAELIQYSTVMDTEKLLTIQNVMNVINEEYE
ncbi:MULTISPECIES: hypothetical protein [unclassified Cedecea]|uniref:hypothetical protein n=1 Tax=unclassified Cedecea TaxID=2649846 RepID=UPI00301ACDAA